MISQMMILKNVLAQMKASTFFSIIHFVFAVLFYEKVDNKVLQLQLIQQLWRG